MIELKKSILFAFQKIRLYIKIKWSGSKFTWAEKKFYITIGHLQANANKADRENWAIVLSFSYTLINILSKNENLTVRYLATKFSILGIRQFFFLH